jgi:hypothetical protein
MGGACRSLRAHVGAGRAAAALGVILVVIVALGTAPVQAAPPAPATVVDNTRVSDPNSGFAVNGDFTRVFFLPGSLPPVLNIGRTDLVYQGKLIQARAFMSATILYQPALRAIDNAHFVGSDDPDPSTNDLVAMRCEASDPSQLKPRVASWPNVFTFATSDLADLMGYTPADCLTPDLDPGYPVDQRVYCKAQNFSDQANVMVPLVLQNAIDTGATIFQYTGTPFEADPRRTTGSGVLSDVYGIGSGFSGLGYSVENSFLVSEGGNVPLTAAQSLEQSVVTEYLVMNVPLKDANCRCVRVRPYNKRDMSLLRWDRLWNAGKLDPNDGHCVSRANLP